ncbi:N-(5'-phosphoribosyl)anthranilate isomerase [Anatilimnocola aggregata]|uniref:N-(5'-phosphoribosyl)anthranilate isomerase n=1 Tax=Anatilimnocola aggregata TaxID=2528021 RepID=A0A517YKF4_9BACT|nr:phosphoribosylanthranilate isomerase [Anatilimnocola aggregata]QDU30702.1 N-(5'-phosphoribosyl)anthranilate isomerase [Anatilimnocola aggregata]
MFRIKICGITNVDDALQAIEAGADALGLNFYKRSPRYVTPEQAAEIVRAVRTSPAGRGVTIVGVFVNESQPGLMTLQEQLKLDAWQLHGDEPVQFLAALSTHPDVRVSMIRAYRCKERDLSAIANDLLACDAAVALPSAVLLDAYAPDAFGGTGKVVDWNVVRDERDQLFGLPVILAGGLTAENVAEAVRIAQPDAVDVASGVESSPGKKDSAKVRDFIAAAKAALAAI